MRRGEFQARLALARARGVRPRRVRVAEPLAQERRYRARILERVLAPARELVRERLEPALVRLANTTSRVGIKNPVYDADAPDLGDILDEVSDKYFEKLTRREMSKVIRPVAIDVDKFDTKQLNKRLSAYLAQELSVDVVGNEPWLEEAIANFVRENVALVSSIPERFFDELEKTIAQKVADGARSEDLAEVISERYGVAESRAELIARDQVAKFTADLNRTRMRDLGAERFIWRSVGDERVRESHQEYNGKTYTWENAPDGGPGEAILCRCYAEPVFD